ncbi:DUF1674 domain-containing protein [Lysobacter sp. HA18]
MQAHRGLQAAKPAGRAARKDVMDRTAGCQTWGPDIRFPAGMIGHTTSETPQDTPESADSSPLPETPAPERPREVGGRPGPEPTRYGDWEKDGRCIDF